MARLVRKTAAQEPDYYAPVQRIGAIMDQFKATSVKAYDVQGLTLLADAFVLCTTSSEPQFKAIYNGVREGMHEEGVNVKLLRAEGELTGGWSILDYGNIIVHIFREEARAYYDLDGFWGDAAEIPLVLVEEPKSAALSVKGK